MTLCPVNCAFGTSVVPTIVSSKGHRHSGIEMLPLLDYIGLNRKSNSTVKPGSRAVGYPTDEPSSFTPSCSGRAAGDA